MGKFAYALITVLLIEMALFYFGGAAYAETSIFNLIKNPENILDNPVYIAISAALAVFAVAQIIPGNLFQINIYALYAGVAGSLLTFGVSITHLFRFINGELNSLSIAFSEIITILIVMPFLIFYLIAILEWLRGNQ